MVLSPTVGSVDVGISGDVRGQVAIGTNIVQCQVSDGSTVIVSTAGDLPRPRRRPRPVLLAGRAPGELFGRASELEVVSRQLRSSATVALYGESGIGKSSMLKALAHAPSTSLPDGVVYVHVHDQPLEDLLQGLFDVFFEADIPVKPRTGELRTYLSDVHALIVLDDVGLDRRRLEELFDFLPSATFLCASEQRVEVDDGSFVPVRGLSAEAALALVEERLGRPLTDVERPTAEELSRAVDGRPLLLVQAAALVRDEGLDFGDLVERRRCEHSLAGDLVGSLSNDGRTVLAALAAVTGRAVPVHLVARVTGVAGPEQVLDALADRGLTRVDDGRHRSTVSLNEVTDEAAPWPAKWASAMAEWAEAHAGRPEVVAHEAELISYVVDLASRAGAWPEVLRLSQASDLGLLVSRKWGAWKRSLERARDAASKLGKVAALAWALHQLGTRAVTLGDTAEGEKYLAESLRHRESLGEADGARATRRHLEVARDSVPKVRRTILHTMLPGSPLHVALAVTVLAGIGLGVVQAVSRSGDDEPPSGQEAVAAELLLPEPRLVNFESVPLGETGVTVTVVVTNRSSSPRRFGDVEITGAHPDDFVIERDECSGSMINAAQGCTLALSFRPRNGGARSAILVLTTSDGKGSENVALSGVGLGPQRVQVDPALIDFGAQRLSTRGEPRTVTVGPSGATAVLVSSVEIGGRDASDFSLADGCAATSIEATPCRIRIAFAPSALGSRAATLLVRLADSDDPIGIALSGQGIRAPSSSVATTAPKNASNPASASSTTTTPASPTTTPTAGVARPPRLDSSSLDFGSQFERASTSPRAVTLRNEGPSDVTIGEPQLSGNNVGDFALSSNTCGKLPPGGICEMRLAFAPKDVGARSATLIISHTAPGGDVKVTLSGTGTPAPTVSIASPRGGTGYMLVDRLGRVASFTTPACPAQEAKDNTVAVAGALTAGSATCWAVTVDGAVSGSERLSRQAPNPRAPVIGISAAKQGFWVVTSAGEVFAFDGAPFFGSTGNLTLNRPIVAMVPMPSGQGYWFAASDGGIFAFGDAPFKGSTGAMNLSSPIVGMAATPTGDGYWLVAAGGEVFAFGDAAFWGSADALKLDSPIVGMAATLTGKGYWIASGNGKVFPFGDAT